MDLHNKGNLSWQSYNGTTIVFSANNVGLTEHPNAKKGRWGKTLDTDLIPLKKITQNVS